MIRAHLLNSNHHMDQSMPCHSRQSVSHDKMCTKRRRDVRGKQEFPRFLGFQSSESSTRRMSSKRTIPNEIRVVCNQSYHGYTDTLRRKKDLRNITEHDLGNFFRLKIPLEIPIITNVNFS